MGISLSYLGKLGLPGVGSMASDRVFQTYFAEVMTFPQFHRAFVNFCNEINTAFPGKHLKAPSERDLEKFYQGDWKNAEADKKVEVLIEYIKKNVEEHKPNQKAMIFTGLAAPAAATYLKRTGENTPQLKKFRLHLIPNFVFVPTCTLLAVAGVRVLQLRTTSPPQ